MHPVLPVPLTSFIGREADVARLGDLFAGGARLVTLFGPAGTGKTRMALRYAELHGGGLFCELATASTLEEVCRTLAGCLNVPLQAGGGAVELVDQFIRTLTGEAEVLVVLDNCEQVADHVANLLSRWCPAAPSMRFLATSRELLGVAGEDAFEVGPLSLPKDEADTEAEAVRLFVDRARLIRGRYTLGASEAPAVTALVRQLDGLPLAIELAAGWSDVMSATDLLARLPRRLDELSNRARTAADRQRTLRAAIDGSWLLLKPWEQEALAQCAVFRGSFSLEGAEAVLDLSAFPGAPPVAHVVASLRAKSLVRALDPAELASSTRRFALYESIRVYADERLEKTGQRPQAEARHTSHFASMAAAAMGLPVTHATERDQALTLDLENLFAAHARALASSGALDVAIRIPLALEGPLRARGLFRSLSALLDGVLHDERPLDPELGALARVASTRIRQVKCVVSRSEIEEALAFARQAGSPLAEGRALGVLARFEYRQGASTAVPTAEQALELLCREGDNSTAAEIRILLSYAEYARGHHDRARDYAKQGVAAAETAGDLSLQANALVAVSYLQLIGRDLDQALSTALRAEDFALQTGNSFGEGMAATLAAQTLQEQGHFVEARRHYERALDINRRRHQEDRGTAAGRLLAYLGTLEHEVGDWVKADKRYREALACLEGAAGFLACEMFVKSALGALEAARDRPEEATQLVDAAERQLGEHAEHGFASLLRLHRGHVDLALARARAKEGDLEGATTWRSHARERLASTDALYPSEDVRFARRLLERAIGTDEIPSPQGSTATGPLVVGAHGRWLVLPTGERHAVPQKAMRLVLFALAGQRVAHAAAPLSSEDLIRHGWPNDQSKPAAANLRLRVVLSELRALGLKSLLVRTREGYALSPEVTVLIDESPASKGKLRAAKPS